MNFQVLAYLLLATLVLGSAFICMVLFQNIRKWYQKRRRTPTLPKQIKRYFRSANDSIPRIFYKAEIDDRPKSFGVFLGGFEDILTFSERKVLSAWDLIVVDPAQNGVFNALLSSPSTTILGRMDMELIVSAGSTCDERHMRDSAEKVIEALIWRFTRPHSTRSPFNGVLLANWRSYFTIPVCNALIAAMSDSGLEVYLEVSDPDFLTVEECKDIDLESVCGLICRNGTILPNGDRRDYFQMANLRRALRVFAAKSQMTKGHVLMWDTINDDAAFNHSVVKRSFNWCRFYSALSWIGKQSALTQMSRTQKDTIWAEPLSALSFIKEDKTVKYQEHWRNNERIDMQTSGKEELFDKLDKLVPNLASRLSLYQAVPSEEKQVSTTSISGFRWNYLSPTYRQNPLSVSPRGHSYTGLGCFQLGLDCSHEDFDQLVVAQRRLRDLNMLQQVRPDKMQDVIRQLGILEASECLAQRLPDVQKDVEELIRLLSDQGSVEKRSLNVYLGMHSGFRTTWDNRFWGLYDFEEAGRINLYLSLKAPQLAGAILHTFLSSRQHSRVTCLLSEFLLAVSNNALSTRWQLPLSFVSDIAGLTPAEAISLASNVTLEAIPERLDLATKIRACCEYHLIDQPTITQLRDINSVEYLSGNISPHDLVASRLRWYKDQGVCFLHTRAAITVFEDIDRNLPSILFGRSVETMTSIDQLLSLVLQGERINAAADFFCFALFCAMRKLALEEIYLEVLDRNPLPNPQPDQSACFAEMFALGSRCQAFFDMTPNAFGRILKTKHEAHYKIHQPPPREEGFTELPTAYASKQVDLDPDAGEEPLPLYYKLTFLGIFAFPALIDITLLTTIGRGLYLSTYMSEDEKSMATTALMVALFLTGAIGTWIGSGGSYYLFAMAFPTMNLFVLTRWVAGLAISIIAGIVGFICITAVKGPYPALIFLLYLVMLSTYLSTLAALSIYQLPGHMFQSGRLTVMCCIPILFISPILTLWIGHDIIVYLSVLAGFLTTLLLGAAKIAASWSTWYLSINFVSDQEISKWYKETQMVDEHDLPLGVTDISTTPIPRMAFSAAVEKERLRSQWSKPTNDELVLKIANAYSSTKFLMSWYCKYSRTQMPFPYTTTWNLQCRAAIDTLKSMQKGLKLHNAFIHWRQSGAEVYCGVLYFIVALMDKWVALITGGSIVGLSAADSADFRLPVGFALVYYLISAICLDAVAQPLWPVANTLDPIQISSLQSLEEIKSQHRAARRKAYWSNLAKFLLMHIWAMSVTTALLWTFSNNRDATIMYLGYMGAYTGLLWYQYSRIFTGTSALPCLVIAASAGLIVGPVLHHFEPSFFMTGVVALAVSTWTTAVLCLGCAGVGWPLRRRQKWILLKDPALYNSGSALGLHVNHSQTVIASTFNRLKLLPEVEKMRLAEDTQPGSIVLSILRAAQGRNQGELIAAALPHAQSLIAQTIRMWEDGELTIELVSHKGTTTQNRKMQFVSQYVNDRLHVYVLTGQASRATIYSLDVSRRCRRIAETMLQAVAESCLHLSPDLSSVVHQLVASEDARFAQYVSETAKHELDTSPEDRIALLEKTDVKMVSLALLGLDCDRYWDRLPETLRRSLLKRCFGFSNEVSKADIPYDFMPCISNDFEEHVRRCDLAASILQNRYVYAEALEARRPQSSGSSIADQSYRQSSEIDRQPPSTVASAPQERYQHVTRLIPNPLRRLYQGLRMTMKFFIVSIVADPEFQKELDYFLSNKNIILRWLLKAVLCGTWVFCKALQDLIIPRIIIQGRPHISKLERSMRGKQMKLLKDRLVIEDGTTDSTCFISSLKDSMYELREHAGIHSKEPDNNTKLMSINSYNKDMVLCRRQKYSNGNLIGEYLYEHTSASSPGKKRLPTSRRCIKGSDAEQNVNYTKNGFIKSGSYLDHGNIVEFKYGYRAEAKHDDELLYAEYVLDHLTIHVSWCKTSLKQPEMLDRAIPDGRVTEAWFVDGNSRYHTSWSYDHKADPVPTTTMNGMESDTPDMIKHDWFKVLKRPTACSFAHDDPLLSFNKFHSSAFSRIFGANIQHYPRSTSSARNLLWKSWKQSKDIDAVTARYLDEWMLRRDDDLRPYWLLRDIGHLSRANSFLNQHHDTVIARVDLDPEISAWTQFAYKTSDLLDFGTGGDTAINTRSTSTQIEDRVNRLHVLTMDTGTWPNEGGGVSACRRDMVNDLTTIRWHILAECANDYGFPKFQAEKNVQSLTVLPLWGLDYLQPSHGVFEPISDSQIQEKSHNTSDRDIRTKFLPILRSLVKCARAIKLDHSHIEEGTKALLDLNKYFESGRHWSDVWMSDVAKDEWRILWLSEDMDNARPISEWLNVECPTLSHIDNALDMWQRYLFIFSLPVPEKIPDVFQASHHFAGASYGIICKIKRGCAFHVWDHCISWREVTVFLSSAMSFDSPFVGTALMNLSRILSVLTLHHADVVLPCCDYFNPGWEVELGSIENTICHRKTYARKIDPVVNGICNMDSFKPIDKITSDKPTAVMLSHVRFVKDIKNAVFAADIIVNEWGLRDYRLDVYGDMERAPAYATEVQEIIAAKGLRDHVNLRGLGNPSKVLQEAWLFLNSSVSEGLPLAMGEAALSGVPVVCTDVGASFRVVTDQETGKAFSAVCPPNDSYALAKAQIGIMGLLGEWAEFADDPEGYQVPELTLQVSPEQSKAIAQRMYDKVDQRRRLGMRGRANVLSEFSSERYLREHEQMLWLAKHQSRNFRNGSRQLMSASVSDDGLYVERSKNTSYVWSLD